MEKLILRSFLSPGDIVMLTAAVRDLHRCYPKRFLTDVRTSCPALWEHNPHLTPLSEADPEVRTIECHYPLIHQSNQAPFHFIHGFIEYLNDQLGLRIRPTEFNGDIHLSEEERARPSQVAEALGGERPFWIVAAGGKYDYTIKWWSRRRYQAVIDHFQAASCLSRWASEATIILNYKTFWTCGKKLPCANSCVWCITRMESSVL